MAQGPSQTKPSEAPQDNAAAGPAFTGFAEVGYRWMGAIRGDANTYRSIVNLDSGPRLVGLDWTVTSPSRKFFDRAEVRAFSWGGDPYNTVQAEIRRQGIYRFQFDYRKIAYFNALPSFANPGIQQSSLLDERSFDTFRRTSDLRLTLFPSRRISPYVAYTRNSGSGTGVTSVFGGNNNYAVATPLSDHADTYLAGAKLEFNRFHVTLEQGANSFRNDQQAVNAGINAGDANLQPFLGNFTRAYSVEGHSVFTRAHVTGSPTSWISVFAQFLYSRPRTAVRFSEAQDLIFLLNASRIDAAQQLFVSSQAQLPHSSGSVGFEMRPATRLRLIESFVTDRLSTTSEATENQQFTAPVAVQSPSVSLSDRLTRNYSQQQLDIVFDLTPNLTLRGGHRYAWGDTAVRATQAVPGATLETGLLRRHVGLAGVNVRFGSRFTSDLDVERSPGQRTFFRTDLYDYSRVTLRARYRPSASLTLAGNISVLNDANPGATIDADVASRQSHASATWSPGGKRNLGITGEYSRFTLTSRIAVAVPPTFDRALSLYQDDGHVGSAFVSLALPDVRGLKPKLSAGGSFFVSSGSRPTKYAQPIGKLSLAVAKHAELEAEWHGYSLSQTLYPVEAFTAHEFITRLRLPL